MPEGLQLRSTSDFRSQPLAPLLGGGREGEMEEGERQREGGREREEGGKERDFPFPWADEVMEEQKDNTDCRLESTFLPICSSVS